MLADKRGGRERPQYDNIADKLADADYNVGSLAAEDMAQVTDLKINTSLPADWMNILLLGTDERTLSDSARTDAMMICSINRNTGEVKLASIMRDLAIEYTDIGQWNGTYRINAANYFGGPKLAMRTINEKFGMNIQNYVMVNFFGFQKIAQRLGGVEIDITEAEMDKINKMIVQQAKIAYNEGIDESDQENVYLETYGENTHLNGRQTLAYARISKLTGGDAMRTGAPAHRPGEAAGEGQEPRRDPTGRAGHGYAGPGPNQPAPRRPAEDRSTGLWQRHQRRQEHPPARQRLLQGGGPQRAIHAL